jgi:catechol 2,3-dioxygenase-like lactoylglutathione lyase family enzyme
MLANHEVRAVIAASNIERAKKFYTEKLGLEAEIETPGGIIFKCKGSHLLVYPTQFAGTAKNTVASWETDHIEKDVEGLRARGVVFEEYDIPGFKTVNGIAITGKDKAAWFKDSEGNILALFQMGA